MQRGMTGARGAPDGAAGDRPYLLRISLTDRCNLRCRYCMPESGVPVAPREDLPTLEELEDLVGWLASVLPIGRVKLTGGEPLARGGVVRLARALKGVVGIRELSMTTNGTLLAPVACCLAAAGLDRVSLSLDTLDPGRYRTLTRGGELSAALAGLAAAREAGLEPVKINAVLLASWWREDVPRLLDLAAERRVEVRFIELMRTGTEAAWAARELVEAARVRAWLAARAGLEDLPGSSGPARRTRVLWRGEEVTVGWITPRSHPFCRGCVRLRMDARGRLRRCLMDPQTLDLRAALERDPGAARRAVEAYLADKRPPEAMDSILPMVSVGG